MVWTTRSARLCKMLWIVCFWRIAIIRKGHSKRLMNWPIIWAWLRNWLLLKRINKVSAPAIPVRFSVTIWLVIGTQAVNVWKHLKDACVRCTPHRVVTLKTDVIIQRGTMTAMTYAWLPIPVVCANTTLFQNAIWRQVATALKASLIQTRFAWLPTPVVCAQWTMSQVATRKPAAIALKVIMIQNLNACRQTADIYAAWIRHRDVI